MSDAFYQLAVVSIAVAIDNALLAGMLLPPLGRRRRMHVIGLVAVALGVSQVILAMGVGSLIEIAPFRLLATGVLIWMSVNTVRNMQLYRRGRHRSSLQIALRVFFYSALGNLDNMIWLGTYLEGHFWWLTFFSLITIPLFIMVAVFLSDQCQKYGWIAIFGAGMMAWAAASLCLTTPLTERIAIQMPSLLFHVLFTMVVLVAGFAVRKSRSRMW